MDRLIYTAASGARATAARQDGLTQNLANANTPGFRADLVAFRAVPVRGEGATTRVLSLEATAGFDDKAGPVETTGRAMDVSIQGRGYFAVQANDGTEAYTRHGGFEVSPDGVLVNHNGLPVSGEGGALNAPANSMVSIAPDGTVTAKPATGPSVQVGKLKIVNPEPGELKKGADGLLRMASGEDAPSGENMRVASGTLEGSNVNVVEAMVGMIAAARQFETQMKLLQNAEQNDQKASALLGQH